ncbi:uncharacterized protein DUF4112 [Halospina denitrificans]|uniref:Uncharacterized protein DUF4112 n=1 Tax=Halospina denitrificans TaxID=332522 RepID=A0A4R7JHH6_9GAMM|nr:DUF4112 domain-containing protein [Halospina denitrificans]TDT37075.1 uncharacterized protein DUF4112 [Halospina denitrificans]
MIERGAISTDREHYRATLERLRRFARLTDSRFRIPFTSIRFGVGPILGVIPVVGDLAGLALSGYVILEARRVQAPGLLQLRMLGNGVVDALGGVIPFVGDVFDVWFKANDRNVELLTRYLEQQLAPPPSTGWRWLPLVIAALGTAFLIVLFLAL